MLDDPSHKQHPAPIRLIHTAIITRLVMEMNLD